MLRRAGRGLRRCHPLLDDAVRFVSERVLADGPQLKPAYTVTGGQVPRVQHLDLPGHPGATVMTGNRVGDQFQLDACGGALLLLGAAARLDYLDSLQWKAVQSLVQTIKDLCREPDIGIWELDQQRWAHSRLTCAAGCGGAARHRGHGTGARGRRMAASGRPVDHRHRVGLPASQREVAARAGGCARRLGAAHPVDPERHSRHRSAHHRDAGRGAHRT